VISRDYPTIKRIRKIEFNTSTQPVFIRAHMMVIAPILLRRCVLIIASLGVLWN